MAASAAGTFAFGDSGESKLAFDVAVTNVEPLAKRFNQPLAGSAQIVGEATGPASNLTITGTLGGNRLQYGTRLDALTLKSLYTVQLPDFDFDRAKVQADTGATFMTIAGHNFPRVTARAAYDNKQLEFEGKLEEERRSLGLGGNVAVSSGARRASSARARLHRRPDAVVDAAGPGSDGALRERLGDAREFRAAAGRSTPDSGRHGGDGRRVLEPSQRSQRAARQRAGAGHQRADAGQPIAHGRAECDRRHSRHPHQSSRAVRLLDHRWKGRGRRLQLLCGQGELLGARGRCGRPPRAVRLRGVDGRRHHPCSERARRHGANR